MAAVLLGPDIGASTRTGRPTLVPGCTLCALGWLVWMLQEDGLTPDGCGLQWPSRPQDGGRTPGAGACSRSDTRVSGRPGSKKKVPGSSGDAQGQGWMTWVALVKGKAPDGCGLLRG